MPRRSVRFFYSELWAVVIGDVEAERQVLVSVLVEVVGDILLVDPVLVSVDPVVPDDVVDQLFFQCPAELIYRFFRDSGFTIRVRRRIQRGLAGCCRSLHQS